MDFETALKTAFKNAYSWMHDSKALKYYAILALLGIATSTVSIGLLYAAGLPISQEEKAYEQVFKNNLGGALAAYAGIIFLAVASGIAQFYIGVKILKNALEKQGLETIPLGVGEFARYMVLLVLAWLHAVFSWFDKKFLALLLIGAVFGFGAIAAFALNQPILGVLALILAILPLAAYLAIYIRNSVRLGFSACEFLRSNAINHALQYSWEITSAQALKIFGALLLVNLAFAIVAAIASLPVAAISWALETAAKSLPSIYLASIWLSSALNNLVIPLQTFFSLYIIAAVFALLAREQENANAPKKIRRA